jgi:glutathione S-transferase
MIKIVSFTICPFVQRVTAFLEAKGLDYEVAFISLQDKPQWFLDISPNGQVPVLISEDGRTVFESEAIVEYIEEKYGALQPGLSPETRAQNRAWGYLAAKNYLVQCSAQRAPSRADLDARSAKLGAAFDKIEAQLGGTRFFGGSTPGWVDIAWLVLLHRAAIIEQHSGFDFIGSRPRLKRWQQNLLATGLAEKSVAADFTDAFTAFYLSQDTYLGRGQDAACRSADDACATGSCC